MNHWLEEARHRDPVGLFSTYIRNLNRVFEKRRDEYRSMNPTALPSRVAELYNKSLDDARKLVVLRNTSDVFEVQRKNFPDAFRVVRLGPPSCYCGFFQEYGIACRHICAAVLSKRENPQDCVVPVRRLAALRETYTGVTIPVDISTLQNDGLKAVMRGKRRKRPIENRYPYSVENRPRKTVTCGRCHAPGHNSRTCKAHLNGVGEEQAQW